MNEKLESHRLEWLARLAMKRPVYVFADELGPCLPFARGIVECVDYLEPWSPTFQPRYFGGAVAWGVPLGRILARVPSEKFLEIVRTAQSPWVKGRPWPWTAIDWLARGDENAARKILEKELLLLLPNDLHRMDAASIWYYLFSDREKAKKELEAAGALLKADEKPDPSRNELARRWIEMFGDRKKAFDVVNDEIIAVLQMKAPHPYCKQALASTFLILGHETWAKKHVPDAARLATPECDWHGFDAAACWMAIFNDSEMARACVDFGVSTPSGYPATHAVLCKAVMGDEATACLFLELCHPEEGQGAGAAPTGCAEGWMLCFGDRKAAAKQLSRVTPGCNEDEVFKAVLYWRTLLGDDARAEALLAGMLELPHVSPCDLLSYCESYVKERGDANAARSLMKSIESRVATAKDWTECARVWWQALADRSETSRCLQNARECSKTAEDMMVAFAVEDLLSCTWPETWSDRLGDMRESDGLY